MTFHMARVPVSMVGESAGILISTAILCSPEPITGRQRRGNDVINLRQGQPFQIGRIGHRHVLAGYTGNRRIKPVKSLFHHLHRDLGPKTGKGEALLAGDKA